MNGPVDEIKARINIADFIGESVKLRRSGRSFAGLCPFHAHTKNTPSFAVWPETGTWRCFGQCNEGGDIFKFVMKKEGWSFREALEFLAVRAGIDLKPRTPQEEARQEENERLRQLLALAVTYYQHLLKNAPQAQHARDHLAGRGLKPEVIESFQLGYALPATDAAQKFFIERGYPREEMIECGLAFERDDGSVRDRFRNRVMIPINDARGRVVGFGARALDPNDVPKFLNSPQTPLFSKGDLVYGLDVSRKAISASGVAVLVEGYMDVIAAHQGGFNNVVSAMGTALTETQLRLMRRFAKRIVLALDADTAGDKATLRGLTVARETLDQEYTPTFDARGLIRSEGKLKADIRVLTLPAGLDPDDVINADPEAWRNGVANAMPVLDYVIEMLTSGRNLDDPKEKSEAADEILPIIQDVADPVEQDAYRQKLARILKVDERALALKLARPERRTTGRARPKRGAPPPEAILVGEAIGETEIDRLESYCLSALVHYPDLVAKADRLLRKLQLMPLSPDDFGHTELQLIFASLKAALEQDQVDPLEYLFENVDETLSPPLQALLEKGKALDGDETKRADDVIASVMRLRKRNIDRSLKQLRFLQEDPGAQPESTELLYQDEIMALVKALQSVTRALGQYTRRAERMSGVGAN